MCWVKLHGWTVAPVALIFWVVNNKWCDKYYFAKHTLHIFEFWIVCGCFQENVQNDVFFWNVASKAYFDWTKLNCVTLFQTDPDQITVSFNFRLVVLSIFISKGMDNCSFTIGLACLSLIEISGVWLVMTLLRERVIIPVCDY